MAMMIWFVSNLWHSVNNVLRTKEACVLFDESYDTYTQPSSLDDSKLMQTLWYFASVGVYYVTQ
jgi:hypothetical protein